MAIKELNFSDNDGEEIEGTEVSAKNMESVKATGRDGSWVNEKRNPISIPIRCLVPQKIVIMMRSVERIMQNTNMGALEFGAFLNGKLNEQGVLMVSEDFYLPAQKVSGGSIDFDEEPPEPKYNGVIHRHPTGCKSFSGTDGTYINSNFEFSLLYEGNEIIKGIFNLEVNSVRIQLPLNVEVMYPVMNLSSEQISEKIHRKEIEVSSSTGGNFLPGFFNSDRRDFKSFLNTGIDDDDKEEKDDDSDEKMYTCNRCGHAQFIGSFPCECESCDVKLNMEDVEEIDDLSSAEDIRPSLSEEEDLDEYLLRSRRTV